MTTDINYFVDEKSIYLYKHVDATDGSLCILSESTLKFTQPKNFNDPFDCCFSVDETFYPNSTKVKEMLPEKRKLTPAQRILDTQKNRNFFRLNKQNNPLVEHVHRKAYICCLNQNPLNILMWSHYAQFHQGFLIEFKLDFCNEEVMSKNNFTAQPVQYVDDYPLLNRKVLDSGQVLPTVFHKKSKVWEYEREFRVVRYSEEKYSEIQSYPRNIILNSIVCGINMKDDFRRKIVQIMKSVSKEIGRDIPVYNAEKIPHQYSLTVPNHPRLDVLANAKKKK